MEWLASLLVKSGIAAFGDSFFKPYLTHLDSKDKTAADLAKREIDLDQRQAEVNAQIVIAEQGRWYTACIRPLMALPFIVFTWKVVIWDKALGWGVTDALDPNMWSVFMIVIGAYFGGRSVEKVARILKR